MSSRHPFAPRITLLIVDDHVLIRMLLRNALGAIGDFEVVGESGDAASAIELAAQLRPDILLLDSFLPGDHGPAAVERIAAASPRTRVLMFSGTVNLQSWQYAYSKGARGFVSKSSSMIELAQAIRSVHDGSIFISRDAQPILRAAICDAAPQTPERPRLSPRETDVLSGIARGLGSKQIAAELGLSVFTVENHRRRLGQHTGLKTVAELTLFALQLGLITPPQPLPGLPVAAEEPLAASA
jgi:DNA-binding NarL/FixJ family response regulator